MITASGYGLSSRDDFDEVKGSSCGGRPIKKGELSLGVHACRPDTIIFLEHDAVVVAGSRGCCTVVDYL